ncbi:NADH-quinone oxidoreductase subunit J [Sulfurovum sp. bin170]|uniref:NADH-quinone oxidoreductase subunit J n=1 Tax=Sulfurovum sp. bin170 TaxID=2695268 RepID=UPI0013DFBF3C|nr:NADH-quinone oxidoreductase subunit J [Sulfurovum sp. bin170]NEW60081.1 NADH-quinone oxidoreductase subunit J [Sulfurovum sp. bin170]
MYEFIAFYIFAISTVVLFGITVMSKNVLYAMTSLAGGMVMISGFFFLLGADFLGVVQLIVYVGAVMALYAFAMMFFDATKDIKEKHQNPTLTIVLGALMALVFVFIFSAPIIGENIEALYPVVEGVGNAQAVGMVLFTKYLVPFELAAVMLLVAMIAGIILAGKKMDHSLTTHDDAVDEVLHHRFESESDAIHDAEKIADRAEREGAGK